jgi:hypothetical protein
MGESRKYSKYQFEGPPEKMLLERSSCVWEDDIEMNPGVIDLCFHDMNWTELAWNRELS